MGIKDVSIMLTTQVKDYLDISSTGLDDSIDKWLPVVDSKVKQITRSDWRIDTVLDTTTSTGAVENVFFGSVYDTYDDFQEGAVIKGTTGTEISDDTYITTWSSIDNQITLSSTPSAASENVYASISTFPKGFKPDVAKMVFYNIINSTTDKALLESVKSRSLGPSSITFGDASTKKIDGYPEELVMGLMSIRQVGLV